MQKSEVLHWILKIQQKMRRQICPQSIYTSNSHKKKWPLLCDHQRTNFPPHLKLYFWYSMQNFTLCISLLSFFSFLLLMDHVCSCSVVSIHFIFSFWLVYHSFTKKLFHFLMCVAFTTIFVFLLLYCLVWWILSLYSYMIVSWGSAWLCGTEW